MFFSNQINSNLSLKYNLVPVYSKSIDFFKATSYSTQNHFSKPTLFTYVSPKFSSQKKRKFLRVKSERGVFSPLHKLRHFEGVIPEEEKEYLSDERSRFPVPNMDYALFMHTGQEYKMIPSTVFKATNSMQRGYDYYRTYTRREDIFFYKDPIFLFKKGKLGEYIFTKRTGGLIHTVKKKK